MSKLSTYKCQICTKKYVYEKALQNHIFKDHNVEHISNNENIDINTQLALLNSIKDTNTKTNNNTYVSNNMNCDSNYSNQVDPILNNTHINNTINNSTNNDNLCVICLVNEKDTAFFRCGHKVCCNKCARIILNKKKKYEKKCPVCRREVVGVLKIFE